MKTHVDHAPAGLSPGGRLLRVLLVTAALLLVPAIAMHYTHEVRWGAEDFLVAAALLAAAGCALEFANARPGSRRLWVAGAICAAVLLIWAELAVGIFH